MKNQRKIGNRSLEPCIISESGGRLSYYFISLFVLVAVPYLVSKFNENPTLITILIAILLFIFLPMCFVEYFFVEKDKIIVLYKSLFFLQFLNRKRVIKYDEIERIIATLKHDKKTDIASFFINITSKFTAMSLNVLEVQMKNGKKKYINTQIYKENLMPIIDYMKNRGVDIQIIYPDKRLL